MHSSSLSSSRSFNTPSTLHWTGFCCLMSDSISPLHIVLEEGVVFFVWKFPSCLNILIIITTLSKANPKFKTLIVFFISFSHKHTRFNFNFNFRRSFKLIKSLRTMKRVFGVKAKKEPPPSIEDANERITKRGDTVDEKIKKLDIELNRYKEQIQKTKGPTQQAIKARAMRVLKQKRMYEGQRDMLYNQTFNLDQVQFAAEGIKDAQQTMSALKSANKDLKGMMKTVKIQDIDNLQDEMMDLMDVSNEIQETLGRSYSVPDDIDEEDLMGELDALEADMENESEGVPSYLQPDKESDFDSELNLPSAPTGQTAVPHGRANAQTEDELGLPAVPRASLRG